MRESKHHDATNNRSICRRQ